MPRASTSLDNREYDDWLAKQGKGRELKERQLERKRAVRKDLSGYYFNIDPKGPVKINNIDHLRVELNKRGLAIDGEYKPSRSKK